MEKPKPLTKRQKIIVKTKASAKKLKREIKKSISTAIVAAFGFLIALSWRDVIKEYVNKISSLSPIQGNLISAVIITIISVIGILIITKFLSGE
ncbi:hypothetical protein KAJ87_01235 [Candidatus Pacearchaeota archaeon]|nr:hypothetical protein [Candidatus Pacearchaeota archaeon]